MGGKKSTKAVAKKKSNDIAVFNDLFGDIDFSTLNGSIESLASVSGNLNEDEKSAATNILHEWESNVLERLNARNDDVNNFLGFLTGREYYNYQYNSFEEEVGIDVIAQLAKKTKTTKEFKAYLDAKDALDAFELTKPEEPIDDVTISYEEKEIERRQYELLQTKYDIGRKKASRKITLTRRAWLKVMVTKDEIKELVKNLNSYKRKLNKFKGDCKAKSQNARLNVAISSKEAREAIKDLLDFAIEI
jgi:hypothetical protein